MPVCLTEAERSGLNGNKQAGVPADEPFEQVLEKGRIRVGENRHEEALRLFFQARDLARDRGDLRGEAEAHSELGNLFFFARNDFPLALAYTRRAEDAYRHLGDLYQEARHANNGAEIRMRTGEYARAVAGYMRALRLLEGQDLRFRSARRVLMLNVARVSGRMGDTGMAWVWARRARGLLPEPKDDWQEGQVLSLEGELFEGSEHWDRALESYQKAWGLMEPRLIGQSALAAARIRMQARMRLGRSLMGLGRLKEARSCLEQAEQDLRVGQDQYGRADLLLLQARLDWLTGQKQVALRRGELLARFCQDHLFSLEGQRVHRYLSEWWGEVGEEKQALRHARLALDLRKNPLRPAVSGEIQRIIATYEQAVQGARFSRLVVAGGWMMALGGLLVLVLGWGWWRYALGQRQRHRTALAREKARYEALLEALGETGPEGLSGGEAPAPEVRTPGPPREVMEVLVHLMEDEKVYRDQELSLEQLSRRMGINRTYLSQAVNQYWGGHFNDFVNHYRVKEAQERLRDPGLRDAGILGLAFDVGFNSKSTFNRVFKNRTGMTPRAFREQGLAVREP